MEESILCIQIQIVITTDINIMKVYHLGMNYLGVLYYKRDTIGAVTQLQRDVMPSWICQKKVLKYYLIRLIQVIGVINILILYAHKKEQAGVDPRFDTRCLHNIGPRHRFLSNHENLIRLAFEIKYLETQHKYLSYCYWICVYHKHRLFSRSKKHIFLLRLTRRVAPEVVNFLSPHVTTSTKFFSRRLLTFYNL